MDLSDIADFLVYVFLKNKLQNYTGRPIMTQDRTPTIRDFSIEK